MMPPVLLLHDNLFTVYLKHIVIVKETFYFPRRCLREDQRGNLFAVTRFALNAKNQRFSDIRTAV